MASQPIVILSPVRVNQTPGEGAGSIAIPNWEYYDVTKERSAGPLRDYLRWVLYPWAYGAPAYGTQFPPGG
jgi:hypothetical protein